MKNLKKISLISFLACATLAGGILTANTEVETPVQEQKFYMVDGAQVRVPDVVEEGAEDFDGLRFTAKMTDAYRVAKGELENMQVGMFIYPTAYADGVHDVNYDNCFGEGACYYWAGNDADTEGKKQILHVEAYAYEEVAGADELTIQASVWNMLPANLGLDFSAVAYLKVTNGESVEYHFAETGAGAKAVSVAQKALLNKKDDIHAEEGAADRVNAAYVTPFLGEEGVEVAYTETIYKQQKDGSYALIEENVEKTGVVKAYNTQAPKAYDNYAVYSRESTARDLLIDGSADITTYYNYAGNRVVLWDGDEYLSDSSYVHKQLDEFAMQILPDNFYEGNYALMYNTEGWEGPWWKTGKVLPAATDTFSMIMEMGKDITTGEPTVYQNWDVYLYHTASAYVMPASMTFENLETGEVTEVEGAVTNVATGFYKLTMKFANAYSQITGFGFRTQIADGFPTWKMDNLCAEDIKTMGTTKVDHLYTDTISFSAPEVIDTTAWEGESELVPTVKYKSNLATDYSDLTAEDGVYTITPDAEAYKYEIVINGQSYTTVKGVSLINFNVPFEERSYMFTGSTSQYGRDGTGEKDEGTNAALKIVELDGDKYMTVNANSWWAYANKKKVEKNTDNNIESVAGFTPTKIGVWVYAPSATTVDLYNYGINGNEQYGNERNIPIGAGYSYVEYTFAKDLAGTYAVGFGFGANMSLYIQEIVLIA